jgi:hypothetical protein
MNPEQEIALGFAALFLVLALWREIVWFRRFSAWQRAEGVVASFRAPLGHGSSCPVIGYSVGGIHKTFVSSVCLYNPKLGAVVDVLVDPKSDGAVMLTRRHRWMLTGLCGAVSFVMLGVAALSH